jgi:chromosome segregation protein
VRARLLKGSSEAAEREISQRIEIEAQARAEQDARRQSFEAGSARLEELEQQVRTAARERGEQQQQLASRDLALQELRMRQDQLRERMRERYSLDIATYTVPEAALQSDPEEREAELKKLRASLESLGSVHLGAIEEYEGVAERHRYLTEQKADLELSIERLQNAIARINRTSRARFRETFDAVNLRFQELFPRMFRGGRAELQLTESEDVLEAGIEIHAQPPGKRLQSVNLLSGGEKSLTALALLLAVFSVKPSPFFLLDEVDAALDDANVGRFDALLREMAHQAQFLVITHNQSSIEGADTLFGVTMEEPGRSKLVSVDLVKSAAPAPVEARA